MEIRDISKQLKNKKLEYNKIEKIEDKNIIEENFNINSDCEHKVINVIDENFSVNVSESSTDMKSINDEIGDLYNVYKDISILVNEQGEILDRIDYNIETTETNVEEGKKDIVIAHKKKKKKRTIIILIVSIILIILITIGILVYFNVIKIK